MAEGTVTSQHTVEGSIELPDSADHMMEVGYKVNINPWGDTCTLTYPEDACLGDDEEEINDAAMEMAYEDAYEKVREEFSGEVNTDHADRYQLLLDRLDGEKTEHGECRVAKRIDALENALRRTADALNRAMAVGLFDGADGACAFGRDKVMSILSGAKFALEGGKA